MFENIRRDIKIHFRPLHNPSLWALVVYRFGVWSLNRRWRWSRWVSGAIYYWVNFFSDLVTRVHISREAVLGKDFQIVHTGPIHIGPGVVIGDRCVVMHNVTIGACITDGTPVIGDDVFIATGASVLGDITIGEGAKITANSLVIDDVAPYAAVAGVPARAFADPSIAKALREKREGKPEKEDSPNEEAKNPVASPAEESIKDGV